MYFFSYDCKTDLHILNLKMWSRLGSGHRPFKKLEPRPRYLKKAMAGPGPELSAKRT